MERLSLKGESRGANGRENGCAFERTKCTMSDHYVQAPRSREAKGGEPKTDKDEWGRKRRGEGAQRGRRGAEPLNSPANRP